MDPSGGYVPPGEDAEPSDEGSPVGGERPPGPRRMTWVLAVVLGLVLLAAAGGFAMSMSKPQPKKTATPATPAEPDPRVGSKQAKAVADLLAAYATDDRAQIDVLLTADNLPWTASAPPIPAAVPSFLLKGLVEPHRSRGGWAVGDPSFALVQLRGDGLTPAGEVAAKITYPQGTATATAQVVLERGRWKIATINGRPVADALSGLLGGR